MSAESVAPGPGTLSVCMIVKNESSLLRRCLESVRSVADEIIVVDTGSTDDTISVARDCGAKVIESPWRNDFAFSRNVSIAHATGSWILWLDADDVVPRQSLTGISKLKQLRPDRVYGFIVRNERPGNTGTEFTQARMFPRHPSLRFERTIHEQIMPAALAIGMKLEQHSVVIEHHGYADPETLRKKATRNISMLLKEYPTVAPDPVMAAEIGDSYWLVEDVKSAFEWYGKVVEELDTAGCSMPALLSHAWYGMGNVRNVERRYVEALDYFRKAQKSAPWRPDVLYSMAVAYELAGDPTRAVETLRKILPMEPVAGQVGVDFRAAKIKAYLRLARLLVESDRIADAGTVINDALSTAGNRPEIKNMAGKYCLRTGALMDALHLFEQSISLHRSGNFEAYIGLCCVYLTAKRDELVLSTLDALREYFKDQLKFQVAEMALRATAVADLGRLDEYRKCFEELQREFFGVLPVPEFATGY